MYFKNKVPGMIKPIFDNLINQKDQIKAEALMTALYEIHTTFDIMTKIEINK